MTLSPTFTSLASIRARNGRSEELGERLLALVEPARRIEGCISHEVLRAPTTPTCGCCRAAGPTRRRWSTTAMALAGSAWPMCCRGRWCSRPAISPTTPSDSDGAAMAQAYPLDPQRLSHP